MIIEITEIQRKMKELFEDSPYRWIVNVGGKGSGKTDLMIYLVLKVLFDERYKKSRVLLARETLRDLKNTLILGLDRKLRELGYGKQSIYHNSNLQLIMNRENDVEVYYLSLSEKNQQYRSILSYEFNIILIDEVDRITREAFEEVSERFRLLHPFQRGMLNLNPTSKEHWVYKTFAEKPRPDVYILHSSTYDNYLLVKIDKQEFEGYKTYEFSNRVYKVHNNVRYEKVGDLGDVVLAKRFNVSHGFLVEMENKPLAYKRIMLYGEWGSYDYGGGLYEDVFTEENIISRDFGLYDLLFDFQVYCGVDFGINHNAYVLVAVDVYGNIYIIDDFISTNLSVRNFLEYLLQRLKDKFRIKNPKGITFVGDISGKNRELYDGYDLFTKIRKEFGLMFTGHKVKVLSSVALLKDLIFKKKLLVNDTASFSLEGFLGKFRSDGFGNPVKDGFYDHLHDAIRYVVSYISKTRTLKDIPTIQKPQIIWSYS